MYWSNAKRIFYLLTLEHTPKWLFRTLCKYHRYCSFIGRVPITPETNVTEYNHQRLYGNSSHTCRLESSTPNHWRTLRSKKLKWWLSLTVLVNMLDGITWRSLYNSSLTNICNRFRVDPFLTHKSSDVYHLMKK
jgi:hypothetical protein